MTQTDLPTMKPVGDTALLVEFGTQVDDSLNKQVIALDTQISLAQITGIVETVPAMVNLLVIFDPLICTHDDIAKALRSLFPLNAKPTTAPQTHTIPVCYDPDLSPDLNSVATDVGLSVEAVINSHVSSQLRVSMYGFAPGYAYLSGVPTNIHVPRKSTITRGVPTGRVMIAGPQCLITTVVMPTGWSIIGRTGAEVMMQDAENPFLFNVGDNVVFKRITRAELPKDMQTP